MQKVKVIKPKARDIPQILALVNSDPDHLIPRSKAEIRKKLSFWRIIRVNKKIVACGCFDRYSRRMAEIRSFIVQPEYRKRGYGAAILAELLTLSQHGQRVFVVTSLPDFFKNHAFSECLHEKYILFYH
jgi:N-acetylglutamate synthase-like GNAT family acetyltransferase